MRAVLPVALLFLCGCDFSPPANPFSREVTDKSGSNRLALIYGSVGPGPVPNSESLDFHSLVWRTKAGTNWSDRVVITKTDFEAGSLRGRWVSDIYSLDPSTGHAVIKVAEGSPQQTNGTTASTACSSVFGQSHSTPLRLVLSEVPCLRPTRTIYARSTARWTLSTHCKMEVLDAA